MERTLRRQSSRFGRTGSARAKYEVKIMAASAEDTDTVLTGACLLLSEPTFQQIWDNSLDADYDKL